MSPAFARAVLEAMCVVRVALLAVCLTSAGFARASAQEATSSNGEYETVVRQALEEWKLGNFREMYAAMHRAHELEPSARTFRGMGVAAFELKDYVSALSHLRAALNDPRKALTPAMKQEAADMIKRAAMYVDTVELELTPPKAAVSVDGEPAAFDEHGALLLALGTHELSVSQSGYRSARQSVTATGGASHHVAIALEPELAPGATSSELGATVGARATEASAGAAEQRDEPGASRRTWAYVAFAGAGAFAIASAVAFVVRENAATKYNSKACAPLRSVTCAGEKSRVSTAQTLGIVSAVVAGAVAAGGVVLLLTGQREDERRALQGCSFGFAGVVCGASF